MTRTWQPQLEGGKLFWESVILMEPSISATMGWVSLFWNHVILLAPHLWPVDPFIDLVTVGCGVVLIAVIKITLTTAVVTIPSGIFHLGFSTVATTAGADYASVSEAMDMVTTLDTTAKEWDVLRRIRLFVINISIYACDLFVQEEGWRNNAANRVLSSIWLYVIEPNHANKAS